MEPSASLVQKLSDYQMSLEAAELIRATNIVFLVGITAAGKDTVIGELLKSGDYHNIVSHTTRPPRYNHGILEQNHLEYHFIDLAEAERMLDAHEFIEAKLVHGNVYGTSVAEIQAAYDKSEIALTEIEVQGVAEYRAVSDQVLPIFLMPPNFDVWYERLLRRYNGIADPEEIKTRMETAVSEIEVALEKDYYQYVVNEDLGKTIAIVNEIAHGNTSSDKNKSVRRVASQLREDILSALKKSDQQSSTLDS